MVWRDAISAVVRNYSSECNGYVQRINSCCYSLLYTLLMISLLLIIDVITVFVLASRLIVKKLDNNVCSAYIHIFYGGKMLNVTIRTLCNTSDDYAARPQTLVWHLYIYTHIT